MLQLFAKSGIRAKDQASIPTPPASHRHLVPKSDGWHDVNSAGVSTLLGASGSGSPTRLTSTPVANSIAANSYTTTTIPLAKSFRLMSLIVNQPCRVRLFATAAGAAADVGRSTTDDPPDGRGCILDYVASFAGTFLLSPLVDGSSMETVASTNITALVNNTSGSTVNISVSFAYLPTE